MRDTVFIVYCDRIKRKQSYILSFPYNEQLVDRIRNLPTESRKFHSKDKTWELKASALYELIKSYRGSDKIYFDFGNKDSRKVFVNQIEKIKKKEREKKELLADLERKKKHWIEWKKELEENYLKYWDRVHENLKEGVKLYPHQVVATMFLDETRSALISHEMGLGKAQDVDSKLLTPNGWVRMGDIKVNDFVIGSDGKPKRVLGVYPQGIKDIYSVKFNDGTSARSCDEHLWNVNTYIRNWRKNSFVTKTLRQIIDDGLKYENGNNKNYIPIVKPIEFEERDLYINPYVLGCLLGDGGLTVRDSISFSSVDEQIITEMSNKLPENHQLKKQKNSNKDYYLTADRKNNYINQNLKKLKLSGCNSYIKFIPEKYKYSSINQRMELLRGILDTDGHSRNDSIVELTLASKRLIEDVQFIVESLGGIGRIKEKKAIYNNENKLYWRITIKLPPHFIPFKLERKIKTFVPPTKYPPNRAIVDVEYWGKREAQCILIDSDDHLYVTDHCILTHNTLSSIAYVEMNKYEKVLVITPNSLKFNYYNEVEKFTDSKAYVVNWKKNIYTIEEAKYVIVNYEYFNSSSKKKVDAKWKKLKIEKGELDCVICDESHRLKNTKSNTYKNFKRIFGKDDLFRNKNVSKIFMTGTPAPNRAYELYTVLNQISPLDFPTKKYFYEYYCGMTYDLGGWGWVSNNSQAKLEELYHKIAPYTHRKRKKDVLTDLPDKTYQRIMLEMKNKDYKIYNDIEDGVANDFLNYPTTNPLTIMVRLRQYTSHLKVNEMKEIINTVIETGEKIVIVDSFKESLYELYEEYKSIAGIHTGDQTVEERAETVKRFQDLDDPMLIFFGSIQTINYGLTLTAANKMFVMTVPYSVGEYDQVADRCHRIGQENAVNIYPLIFPDTIDDYVYSSIEDKRSEIIKVIDNEDYTSNVEESVLNEVINKIKRKHGK